MKKTFLCLFLLVSFGTLHAQEPKKNVKPAKPTTEQDEIQKMLKEAQQEIDNMSPEERAEMEKMGIKMPADLTKMIPTGVTDKQLQEAMEDEKRWFPKKNTALIAVANRRLKSELELKSFVSNSCAAIQKVLDPQTLNMVDLMLKDAKQKEFGEKASYATIATMFMLANHAKPALAAYSKEFQQGNVNDYNDLNNFSALCNMMGGVQVSLPILNFINHKFPDNTLVLNNIGQAWYTCGEQDSAKFYFLAGIRLMPDNPQANEGLCGTSMAEGNVAAAENAFKESFKKTYSKEKEDKAGKMGFKIKESDYTLPERMPQDPLGFSNIELPPFQYNLNSYYVDYGKYQDWQAAAISMKKDLQAEYDVIEKEIKEKGSDEALKEAGAQYLKTRDLNAAIKVGSLGPMAIKMNSYLEKLQKNNPDGYYINAYSKRSEAMALAAIQREETIKIGYEHLQNEAVQWREKNCIGMGQKVTEADCCNASRPPLEYRIAQNDATKKLLESEINEYIKFQSESLYYLQYIFDERAFEAIKIQSKIGYLDILLRTKGFFSPPPCRPGKVERTSKVLQKFDDTHCPYNIVIGDPFGIFRATIHCTSSTWEITTPIFKIGETSDELDNFVKGSAWIGITVGKTIAEKGPLKIGAKAGGGIFIDYGAGKGVTDVGFEGGIEAKLGLNYKEIVGKEINDNIINAGKVKLEGSNIDIYIVKSPVQKVLPELKAGANVKIGFMSGGGSVAGSGIFKSMSITSKP